MNEYLKIYFDLLINTRDIEVVKKFIPNITLDKTNEVIDLLVLELEKELQLAIEFNDLDYRKHLIKVIELLKSKKEKKLDNYGVHNLENILIFSPNFLKSLKNLDDSLFYEETIRAIESLTSQEWLNGNSDNPQKYKRLHGVASGLSEVKTSNIRLVHMHIHSNFWYVLATLKKEGNNKKSHQDELQKIRNTGKIDIEKIKASFTKDGKIDFGELFEYANENSKEIMTELTKWRGNKNEK